MKISLNWLKDLTDINWSVDETAEKLTSLGFPVEGTLKTGVKIDHVIAAKIISVDKHPDADRLQVAQVFDGKINRQIVCGAPNIAPDQIVPLALPGAKFSKDFEIKVSKIRGVESHGMLCSEKELGLSNEHAGIMMLPEKATVGKPIKEILGGDDVIFDIDVTPNRPDVLNHVGMAREISVLSGKKVKVAKSSWKKSLKGKPCKISIATPQLCSRYMGKLFTDVKIGPSPQWMVQRLNTCGIRSINNIVDITNYVLLEWGHPLHAFDYDKLAGGEIIVRKAKSGETLHALDEIEYKLTPDDLVVADKTKPVAIAGIMGGQDSGVTATTKQILLESAVFDSQTVRNTSRRLGLRSESSYRFERGTDSFTAEQASLRAAQLIMDLAGGQPGNASDVCPTKSKKVSLELRLDRLNGVLGTKIESPKAEKILKSLGFSPLKKGKIFKCVVPPYRKDILEEIDLVEEITRVVGYDCIPETLPYLNPGMIPEKQTPLELNQITELLKGAGVNETMSSSFVNGEILSSFGIDLKMVIPLTNPLSQEESVMRPLLAPNLLNAVKRNIHHQRDTVRLFEIGKKYIRNENGKITELNTIGIVLYGYTSAPSWKSKSNDVDFYHLKGILESLGKVMNIPIEMVSWGNPPPFYHPNQSVQINQEGRKVGWAGMVHPDIKQKFDLKNSCVYGEWELSSIKPKKQVFQPLPKFQYVQRDFAIVVKQEKIWAEIEETVRQTEKVLLENIYPFDIFSGGSLDADKKSIAFRIVLRHPEHTLSDQEIQSSLTRIQTALKSRCGADIRS